MYFVTRFEFYVQTNKQAHRGTYVSSLRTAPAARSLSREQSKQSFSRSFSPHRCRPTLPMPTRIKSLWASTTTWACAPNWPLPSMAPRRMPKMQLSSPSSLLLQHTPRRSRCHSRCHVRLPKHTTVRTPTGTLNHTHSLAQQWDSRRSSPSVTASIVVGVHGGRGCPLYPSGTAHAVTASRAASARLPNVVLHFRIRPLRSQ